MNSKDFVHMYSLPNTLCVVVWGLKESFTRVLSYLQNARYDWMIFGRLGLQSAAPLF